MPTSRLTPFDLVFKPIAHETFPKIRTELDRAGSDPRDRDRFLLRGEVVTLLRELRPEGGLGEGINQLAALLHHAYLYWEAGEPTFELSRQQLATLLAVAPERDPGDQPAACYVQAPERRVWAEVIQGQPHEPLDGMFVHLSPDTEVLRVLGVFGVHPEREGFSVVEASGPRPVSLARPDGTPVFGPTLPGGAAAGLFSLTGEEELLELGWRIHMLGAWSRELRPRSSELDMTSSQLPAPSS
jgi:hypothetical protein